MGNVIRIKQYLYPMEDIPLLTAKIDGPEYTHLPLPIISPNDKRTYALIKLANEMQVLLVSDPTTKEAASSIKVMSGSMCEPKEFGGLAHFLEHMLFLGSEKYPDPHEYDEFFAKNGGTSDAFTDMEQTLFKFATTNDA
jgi:secreted Zn-dependent insulinase-like peptidase